MRLNQAKVCSSPELMINKRVLSVHVDCCNSNQALPVNIEPGCTNSSTMSLLTFYVLLQDLLTLNARISHVATLVPTAQTKINKRQWKRNMDKNDDVSKTYYCL